MAQRWTKPSTNLSAAAARSIESIIACGAYKESRLVERLGEWLQVKRSSQQLFMYSEDGRGMDVGSERFGCELVRFRPRELFEACRAQEVGLSRYHYFTTPLGRLEGGDWRELIDYKGGAYCSVWIGGRGTTTQAHYDVADNVLFQVVGRKRVRVWNPSQHFAMHVFPDAHPRSRKAQASIDDGPSAAFSLRAELEAPMLDIVLEPGAAISIPAFFFHHCEALDLSVSLNVFAPSSTANAAAVCLAASIPRNLSVHTFCDALPALVSPHVGDAGRFLSRFYESRFAPLATAYTEAQPASSAHIVKRNARPRAPNPRIELDDGLGPRQAALAKCRQAAGPAAAHGVTELVLAHLIEMWGMQLMGQDSASFVAMLRPLAAC